MQQHKELLKIGKPFIDSCSLTVYYPVLMLQFAGWTTQLNKFVYFMFQHHLYFKFASVPCGIKSPAQCLTLTKSLPLQAYHTFPSTHVFPI